MNNQQSWERIVEEYPDKWVALSDYSMDGPTVITAVVRAVCSDNERLSKEKEGAEKKLAGICAKLNNPGFIAKAPEKQVEAARVKLNEVMVERKTFEKLREHAFEDFKQEVAYEENQAVNELVSFTYHIREEE